MKIKSYEGLKVICTEKNLSSGVVGVLTPPIADIIKNEVYTLQFKIVNLNSNNRLDYIKIIDNDNEQSLSIIDPNSFETVGQINEYIDEDYLFNEKLCYLRFKADFSSKNARVLIGRRCIELDEVDKPVFLIREISLVRGSVLVPYEERPDDIKRVLRILQSKIEQNSKGITMKVTSVENDVISNKSSIEMLDNSITLTVESTNKALNTANSAKSQVEILAGQISSKVSAGDVASIIEQNPNSVKIGFNNINNNIQFNESEMQINSSTGKSLTLKNGRLNTYDAYTGQALGYIGRSANNVDGVIYPGQVFGGGYNCYYTAFGLDDSYIYDTDATGKNFDPFITLVYWRHNNLGRGIYFNQQTDFNHAPLVTNLQLRANPTGLGHETKLLSFNSAGQLTLDGTVVGGTSSVSWSNITNKPSTFTPSSHGHAWSEITSKPSTFTPSSHTHNKINSGSYGMTVGGSGVINPVNGDEWIGYNRSWERVDCTDLYYTRYNGISTKAIKSDIKYLKNNNIRNLFELDNSINREDFYDFIKDINFTTFIYDTEKAKSGKEVLNRELNQEELTCGFIMEDIETIDNPVINMIVKKTKNKNGEYEDDSVYQKHIDMGAYHNSIAIALQVEIEKREKLEKEVNTLKNELESLKQLICL